MKHRNSMNIIDMVCDVILMVLLVVIIIAVLKKYKGVDINLPVGYNFSNNLLGSSKTLKSSSDGVGCTMYSRTGCPHCTRQINDLKSRGLLAKVKIIDCGNPENTGKCKEANIPGVPYFKFNSGKTLVGYQPIENILKEL